MARNGSGTYSLPEDPFVFDTVIEETKVNANFADIATEITNSIDKDGQTPITGILQHSVAVGQTANTGSVQGNNPITTEFYEIATCANPGDAVTLPSAVAGLLVIVVNNGANSADVFPASGDKIDGGSTNAAFALASGANALFICQDATDWDTLGGGFFTPSSTTTLTNKSLTAPIITGSSSAAGTVLFKEDTDNGTNSCTLSGPQSTADVTVTLPASTDTLVGKATTDTLTNKTLTAPVLNDPTFDVSVGVTADTGSAQGDGAITSTFVEISTVGTAGDAVTLPSAASGKLVVICNNGANSADVFPASGDAIDGASANAAQALAAGSNRIYICQDGTDWDTIGAVGADAVSGSNIADDSIDSEHYVDGSIDAAHIASNAVTTAKINADAVTGAKIADDAIDSEHYTDGSIDTAHLAADAVTGAKIADDTLDSEHYAAGSIDAEHLAVGKDGALSLDATPGTDHTANGPQTSTLNAGYSSTIMDLVYLNANGKWLEADADATGTSINLLGIAMEAKTDGQAMNVALAGSFVRDDTWNWTIGVPLYISGTLGAITETKPSGSGDIVRTVGYAVTADVIFFNPSSDYVTLA